MAKPPEPIEEVIPLAKWVCDAEVVEVVSTGPTPPKVKAPEGATSKGQKAAAQKLKLKVNRVIFGEKVAELIVEKPEAAYLLQVGNRGPFLIDKDKRILGRYGPDSYALERIEKALAATKR